MSAKEYSIKLEILLRSLNTSLYGKSDEILLNPYKEIILALNHRVSNIEFNKFILKYQSINGQRLQELIDSNYDINQLIADLQEIINDTIGKGN